MLHPAELSLSLDTAFGIGEESFEKIVTDVSSLKPRSIVEFGAGLSSIRLAYAFPAAEIVSIDHDEHYHEQTVAALMNLLGPPANLRLHLRPLGWQRFGFYSYTSYRLGEFPAQVDAVIVDGPPYWVRRGREVCLHQVAPFLRVGARVYLDDTHRIAESRISANWIRAYPALERVAVLDVGHGVHVFEVTAPLSPPRCHPAVLLDHLSARLAEARNGISTRTARWAGTHKT